MSRLTIREQSELQAATTVALEPVAVDGHVADVYLQFANSEPALRGYLQMEACLSEGSLSLVELEAIKLWVSEQTECQYCLSVHTFKARKAGLDVSVQCLVRAGQPTGDIRLDTLLKVARTIYGTPGSMPQSVLDEAYAAGLSQENLVDLTMAMSTIFFTNITNHINDSISPLPPAPSIA